MFLLGFNKEKTEIIKKKNYFSLLFIKYKQQEQRKQKRLDFF